MNGGLNLKGSSMLSRHKTALIIIGMGLIGEYVKLDNAYLLTILGVLWLL